jgi:hypothetical protein
MADGTLRLPWQAVNQTTMDMEFVGGLRGRMECQALRVIVDVHRERARSYRVGVNSQSAFPHLRTFSPCRASNLGTASMAFLSRQMACAKDR